MDRNVGDLLSGGGIFVALRKESVDRNSDVKWKIVATYGRSPQGERG